MAAALFITVLTIAIALGRGEAAPLGERLERVAASAAVLGAWLAITIGRAAQLRFVSPADIDADRGEGQASPPMRRASAILQNTLEQVVLGLTAQAALAVVVTRSALLILWLAGLFSLGRILFWAGYARGAEARAFGFALTFYPSVGVLLVVIATLAGRIL